MYKKDTGKAKALKFFWERRDQWFPVKAFTNIWSQCFVGYKFPARVAEMMRDGFIEARNIWETKFKEYRIKDSMEVITVENGVVTAKYNPSIQANTKLSTKMQDLFHAVIH